jgi:hypothetical protein
MHITRTRMKNKINKKTEKKQPVSYCNALYALYFLVDRMQTYHCILVRILEVTNNGKWSLIFRTAVANLIHLEGQIIL